MQQVANKHQFFIIAIFLAIIFWMVDSMLHYYMFGESLELIPDEANELWMRIVIVSLLLLFGGYVDRHNKIVMQHERDKLQIYQATIHSTQHILNNLLNQMQLIRLEIETPGQYKDDLQETFETCFSEGKILVDRLSTVNALTPEEIMKAVNPEHIGK